MVFSVSPVSIVVKGLEVICPAGYIHTNTVQLKKTQLKKGGGGEIKIAIKNILKCKSCYFPNRYQQATRPLANEPSRNILDPNHVLVLFSIAGIKYSDRNNIFLGMKAFILADSPS